ncbi:class I SAM-dependent methyltransferase [Hydrogenophaga sp. 5NK40-0174]
MQRHEVDATPHKKQPSESIDFDDYAGSYDALMHESVGAYTSDVAYFAQYKVDFVKQRRARPVKKILEYGCGTGRNIPMLRDAFEEAEVIGTDISPASLDIARQHNPGIRFEVETPDLKLDGFDLVFVANVFHHIPPPERGGAMKVLSSRMAPDAEICIFEHNPFNPVTRRIVSTCPFDADAVLLRPSELRRLYDRSGIELVDQSYCLFVPPRFSGLLFLERHLTWLPLGGQYVVIGTPRA